jgi:signal transduction histidine kinase
MIADMMLFARPPQPELARVDVASLVKTILEEMKAKAAERRIEFRPQPVSQAVHVQADATQLTVALRAVIDNALEAIGADGWIALDLMKSENGKLVQIIVRDSGPGIRPDVRRHLFDPYFSGRKAGRGLGLGLAKCWRIVTNHGGTVTAESPPDQGAALTISLPVCAQSLTF